MKNFIIRLIGFFSDILVRVYSRYKQQELYSSLKCKGENTNVAYPFEVVGASNISLGDNVSIRANSCLTAINAKIIIKSYTAVAPYLFISTGNHRMIPGRFFCSIKDSEKGIGYDGDVVINEDVWIASRVTILMGVTVGRGSVIAAGAVVNKDVLPYSVVGGVPAKFIKFKWDIDQIIEHEAKLYPEEERYTREQLASMGIG